MEEADDPRAAMSRTAADGAIDLSKIVPPVQPGQPLSDNVGSPTTVAAPEPGVDKTRRRIAYFLLILLTLVILFQLVFGSIYSVDCWVSANPDQCELATKSLAVLTSSMSPVFTAMIGLVGSVVGFYFGSKSEGG